MHYERWIADCGFKLNLTRNSKPITYQNYTFAKKEFEYATLLTTLIGYDITKSEKYSIIPFAGIGNGYLDKYEELNDNSLIKDVERKNFAYVNSGIIIDKFLFKSNYKNHPPINGVGTCTMGIPSLSLRIKAEYIHPLLSENYAQFKGNLFQMSVGVMLHLHQIDGSRFN